MLYFAISTLLVTYPHFSFILLFSNSTRYTPTLIPNSKTLRFSYFKTIQYTPPISNLMSYEAINSKPVLSVSHLSSTIKKSTSAFSLTTTLGEGVATSDSLFEGRLDTMPLCHAEISYYGQIVIYYKKNHTLRWTRVSIKAFLDPECCTQSIEMHQVSCGYAQHAGNEKDIARTISSPIRHNARGMKSATWQ